MTQFEQFPPPRPRSDILSGSLPLLRRGQRSLSIALSNQLTTAKRLSMGNRRDILGRDVHVGHARPEARPAADDVSIQTPFLAQRSSQSSSRLGVRMRCVAIA